jgi:glucose/arabinose dehydrogenase
MLALLVGAGACERARLPVTAGVGPHPELPPPRTSLIPTVNVAPARGWPAGGEPTAAPGLSVRVFATGLDHPRWLYVLPNGDVLVAETNAPPKPDDNKGIKGWFFKRFQKKAGGAVPSANRPTMHSAHIRDRWDWHPARVRRSANVSPKGCSWDSTAPGIAGPRAAIA